MKINVQDREGPVAVASSEGKRDSDEEHGERGKRKLQGKELRSNCPRSSHADAVLGQGERDLLSLLEQSNKDRVEKLLPIRFTRMAESPFAFFRGTALVQAHDLKGTPSAGIIVQCCGDCHLMNFGEFATPERTLVFDINDFDETLPGPFEWDVKRLSTSFVLAARWLGFDEADARRSVKSVVAAYRTAQARLSADRVAHSPERSLAAGPGQSQRSPRHDSAVRRRRVSHRATAPPRMRSAANCLRIARSRRVRLSPPPLTLLQTRRLPPGRTRRRLREIGKTGARSSRTSVAALCKQSANRALRP